MTLEHRIHMTADEHKRVMSDILRQFAEFCEMNNLNYFLDAGTLLGAVRHKGYIPWDDDIDVNMPRQDYDRFCELMSQRGNLLTEHLKVETPYETIYPFLKISDTRTVLIEFPDRFPMECGVYIDVFPKDGIEDLNWQSRLLCKTSELLRLLLWFNKFSIHAWAGEKRLHRRCIGWFGRKLIHDPNVPVRWQDRLIARHNRRKPLAECKYVTTLVNGEFHKCAPVECFSNFIMMSFEGIQYRVPLGYDVYLRCLYPGDYMELPPEEKRIKHNTKIYWKSERMKENALELK